MARRDDISQAYPPLTEREQGDCASELVWRKMMLAEQRRQSIALEKLAEVLAAHGGELGQIRQHFESWAVDES